MMGDKVNYQKYIEGRILDISGVQGKLQRLFNVLSSSDYDGLQRLLIEAEEILKKYKNR